MFLGSFYICVCKVWGEISEALLGFELVSSCLSQWCNVKLP